MSYSAGCSFDLAMKRGVLLLLLGWAIFSAYVWQSGAHLPERVATHFGVSGQPNGWMTRAEHERFTILAGLAIPGFILGVFALIRTMGDRGLNIPNKTYWLAAERRERTYAFIQNQGLIFAGLMIAFLAGVHRSILVANARSPVSFSNSDIGLVSGGLLIFSLLWVAVFLGYFLRKPA